MIFQSRLRGSNRVIASCVQQTSVLTMSNLKVNREKLFAACLCRPITLGPLAALRSAFRAATSPSNYWCCGTPSACFLGVNLLSSIVSLNRYCEMCEKWKFWCILYFEPCQHNTFCSYCSLASRMFRIIDGNLPTSWPSANLHFVRVTKANCIVFRCKSRVHAARTITVGHVHH